MLTAAAPSPSRQTCSRMCARRSYMLYPGWCGRWWVKKRSEARRGDSRRRQVGAAARQVSPLPTQETQEPEVQRCTCSVQHTSQSSGHRQVTAVRSSQTVMLVARDSDALPQPEFARNAAAEDCFGATGAAAGTAAVAAAVAAAGAARKAEADDAGAAAGAVGCGGAVGCRAVAAPAEADAPLGRAACFTFARSFRSASTATRETVSEAPAPVHGQKHERRPSRKLRLGI